MFSRHIQYILAPVLMLSVLLTTQSAFAQGTATGPGTSHIVEPGLNVYIGDLVSPIPIDLDPFGPPWNKGIADPNGEITAPGALKMHETILNVGDEPWTDWHEIILDPPFGLPQSNWIGVSDLLINGTSIGFSVTGIGTPEIDLFNFSQPVLPGDILQIEKQIEVYPTTTPSGGPLLRILEYPTPEPASAALIGMGSLLILRRRMDR